MIKLNVFSIPKQISEVSLRRCVRITYKKTGFKTNGIINLKFVSTKESRKLNKLWAGNDYATDVLSFVYVKASEWAGQEVADVVICLSIAKKQAKKYKTSLESEICLLLTHATLHVFGFDHLNNIAKTSFANLQSDIMKDMNKESREFFNA